MWLKISAGISDAFIMIMVIGDGDATAMMMMVTNLLYNVREREIHVGFTKRRIVLLEAGQIVLLAILGYKWGHFHH